MQLSEFALAGMAQWIECRTKASPVRFPVRAHAWVADQVPQQGARKRQPHIDVSLPLFLPSPLFKKNKIK